MYFTAEGSNSIARYDPFTDHIDWMRESGQNGTHMLVMTKDLNKMFTSNMGSGSVSMFERAPGEQEYKLRVVIQVGRNPEAIALSPDGKQVWTATFGDSHVAIIDVTAGTVIERFSLSAQCINRLKFTPDTKHVLLSDSENGDLIILDAALHKEVKRLKIGENCEGILVTPDGSRAYVPTWLRRGTTS